MISTRQMVAPDPASALPREQQLALAYVPAAARGVTLGLFALDTRLAALVRGLREPMLGQLRLAWWRDQLGKPATERPQGDPVLTMLGAWDDSAALIALVDGWELMTDPAPLDAARVAEFVGARALAGQGLARELGLPERQADAAYRAMQGWALADLGARLSLEGGRDAALAVADVHDWSPVPLPRSLRPLTVLHGLAARSRGARQLLTGVPDMLAAMRLGLLGR